MQQQQSVWNLHEGVQRKIVIENIKKYIEAYDESWIVIHEALQNSIDAIQRSDVETGRITIELDLEKETVHITDNGRGFPPNKELLCPGITDKENSGDTKGYQGVGLKALMYSTNYFEIGSVHAGQRWDFMAENLYTLLQEKDPFYVEEIQDAEQGAAPGTSIVYSFPKPIVSEMVNGLLDEFYSPRSVDNRWLELYKHIDDDLARREQEISHIVRWYFQTYTYAGCCNRLLGVEVRPDKTRPETKPVKRIEIELIINGINALDKCHLWLREYLSAAQTNKISIKFENKQWDFEEAINYLKSQPKKYRMQAPDVESFSLVTDDWKNYAERYKDRVYIRKLLPDTTKVDFSERYAEFLSLGV